MRWGLLAAVLSLSWNVWAYSTVVNVTISGKSTVDAGKKIQLEGRVEFVKEWGGETYRKKVPISTFLQENGNATWTSSDKSIATVSKTGVVSGKKAGTVTIKLTCEDYHGNTRTASKKVTVAKVKQLEKVSLSGGGAKVLSGKSLTFNAVAKYTDGSTAKVKGSWSSSDKKIATVSSGKVTGKKAGKVKITVSYTEGGITKKASKEIVVARELKSFSVSGAKSVAVGKRTTLTANAKFSDGSSSKVKAVKWSSSNKSVATVSAAGVVTGKKAGTANIKATYTYGGVTKSVTHKITVK